MTNKEISSTFNEMKILFNLKKDIKLTVTNLNHFGEHTKHKTTIICNRPKHKFHIKVISYEIRLDSKIVEVSEYEDILSPIIRTLIHEITHHLKYINHTKKFKRRYFQLCARWCAYCIGENEKEVLGNKDIVKYINRFKLG